MACQGEPSQAPLPPTSLAATVSPQPTLAPASTLPAPKEPLLRVALPSLGGMGMLPGAGPRRVWTEPLYDDLIGMRSDGRLDPRSGAIEAWSLAADGLVWTFTMRQGITLHNGEAATAEDVRQGHLWLARAGLPGDAQETLRNVVAGIDVLDAGVLSYRLNHVDLFFLSALFTKESAESGALLPGRLLATAAGDSFQGAPVGSGPFRLVEASPETGIRYEAIERHWYYGVPRFRELLFLEVANDAARAALLRNGAVDVIETDRAEASDLRRFGFDMATSADAFTGVVLLHEQDAAYAGGNPLAGAGVRQALSLAIDREALAQQAMHGFAAPSMDYPVSPRSAGYVPHAAPLQDMAGAKALMAQAGYASGFALDVVSTPWAGLPEGEAMMETVAAWWRELGVTVQRREMEQGRYLETWAKQAFSKPAAQGVLWLANLPRPELGLLRRDDPYRVTGDAGLDALARAAEEAHTMEAFEVAAGVLQEQMLAQAVVMPLVRGGPVYAIAPGLGGDAWRLGRGTGSINIKMLAAGRDG